MLLLLAGCQAGKSGPAAASKAGPKTGAASAGETNAQKSIDIRRREENMIATCMKKNGFTYIPHVPGDMLNPPAPKPSDYATLKTFRSKYGFGDVFAPYVYPGDPHIAPPAEDADPNDAIITRMDPTQRRAYDVALDNGVNEKTGPPRPLGGCKAEAAKALDPINYLRGKMRIASLSNKNAYDENSPEFKQTCAANPDCFNYNADEARLKPLRDAYISCLKSQGYPVENENFPDQAAHDFASGLTDKYDKDPDPFKTVISPDDARKGLTSEIKVALEDLECGKDYIATQARIDAENHAQAPPSGRLF